MRYITFLFLVILFALAVSCGGGGTEPTVEGDTQLNAMVKSPDIPLDKIPNWNGTPPRGSAYADPIPDTYGFDFPIEWDNPWDRRWGGYSNSTFDQWCLIFDYGDPTEGDNHHWMDAVMVEDPAGYDPGWYMHFTFTGNVDFPGFPTAGYDSDGAFYGFADAAVHINYNGPMPSQAGKFDYKFDLTSEDADGKVPYDDYELIPFELYLPLYEGGKRGNVNFDPADGEFDIAIHATVTYIDYVELFDDEGEPFEPAEFDHEFFGDDTGWGTGCDRKDSAIFTMVEDVTYWASHRGPEASYWGVNFTAPTPLDWFPWPNPATNPFQGYCVDPSTSSPGRSYVVDVWSCYDPNLPNFAKSDHWDLISWILNEREKVGGPWENYNGRYVQRAIWALKYGNAGGMPATGPLSGGASNGGFNEATPGVKALLDAAKANGENYFPGPGEYFAAILFPASSDGNSTAFQMNIIAVDP